MHISTINHLIDIFRQSLAITLKISQVLNENKQEMRALVQAAQPKLNCHANRDTLLTDILLYAYIGDVNLTNIL
jgi:FPC/CPF motif-containing protein YcgG